MKARFSFLTIVVFWGIATTGKADEPNSKSPELQVLDRYIGTWDETVIIKPALWTPEKRTANTTTTRTWILNGNMIENKGQWTPKDEFLHLMTYDEKRMEYRQWYFDKDNLTPQVSFGKWDPTTQTFTMTGTIGEGIKTTGQQHFVDKNNFTWTMVAKDDSGKVVLDMEGKCVRKK